MLFEQLKIIEGVKMKSNCLPQFVTPNEKDKIYFTCYLIIVDITLKMFRFGILFLVFVGVIHLISSLPTIRNVQDCSTLNADQVRIFLTISSLYVSETEHGIVKRELEVNWIGVHPEPEDIVAVYTDDPTQEPLPKPVFKIPAKKCPGGFFRTDVELPIQFFNLSSLHEDHCLGYWATYQRGDNIMSSTCLRIQPFWMYQNSKYLSSLRLNEIMIPGSHDSGSFYYHKERAPLSKYKYAQEESIFNQLVYGIRYFDLRVGYYRNSQHKYYINHNFLRTEHSVISVLKQVRKFLLSTKEIIILDFHNFPIGFKSKQIHIDLLNLISSVLRPLIIPHKPKYIDATFRELWQSGKRIVISYDDDIRDVVYPDLLWPSIPRAWGNKQHPDDLRDYFKDVFEKPTPSGLWACMAELTPNTKTIILHPESGLRVLADRVNRNVTHWFRDLYWQKANIVATDYFLGNDIIDVSIRTNRIKGICPEHTWSALTMKVKGS